MDSFENTHSDSLKKMGNYRPTTVEFIEKNRNDFKILKEQRNS